MSTTQITFQGEPISVVPHFEHPDCSGCGHLTYVEIKYGTNKQQMLDDVAGRVFWYMWRKEMDATASRSSELSGRSRAFTLDSTDGMTDIRQPE